MNFEAIDRVVGTYHLPPAVRVRSSLPDMDYADLFTLTAAPVASPEQWARALFGDAPDLTERFLWSGLLSLRLAEGRSADTVGGWRIGDRGPDWLRLETTSRSLSANLLILTGHRDGQASVSLGTFLRYDRRPAGPLLWTPLSAVHRQIVPHLLRWTAFRLQRAA